MTRVPTHTPSAPRVSAAARPRPSKMPPAATTGTRSPTASAIWGTRGNVATCPVWPPASVPCATTRSQPASTARRACSTLPHMLTTSTSVRRVRTAGRVTLRLGLRAAALLRSRCNLVMMIDEGIDEGVGGDAAVDGQERDALDAYSRVVVAVAAAVTPSVASLKVTRRRRNRRAADGAGAGGGITPHRVLLPSAPAVAGGRAGAGRVV